MAISDDRQRMMPTGEERAKGRKLDYPEAVRLPNNLPNPLLRGEVTFLNSLTKEDLRSLTNGYLVLKVGELLAG